MSATRSDGLQAFTEHMAQRLDIGIPILRAIREFESLGHQDFRVVLDKLRESIERGNKLSEAMDEQPDQFDSQYREVVTNGESIQMIAAAFTLLAVSGS